MTVVSTKMAFIVGVFGCVVPGCSRSATIPIGPVEQAAAHAETGSDLWSIIDRSVSEADGPASVRLFHERLEKLTADEVLRIHQQFSLNLARSYTWELWGAAYVINGGCSDDCFEYFRAALIMRGRSTFETALVNPDSLAKQSFIERPTELEEALSVSRDVYHCHLLVFRANAAGRDFWQSIGAEERLSLATFSITTSD